MSGLTPADGDVQSYGNGVTVLRAPSPAYKEKIDAIEAAAQVERDAIATLKQQVKPALTAVIKHARGTGSAPTALQVSRSIAGIVEYLKLTRELSDET